MLEKEILVMLALSKFVRCFQKTSLQVVCFNLKALANLINYETSQINVHAIFKPARRLKQLLSIHSMIAFWYFFFFHPWDWIWLRPGMWWPQADDKGEICSRMTQAIKRKTNDFNCPSCKAGNGQLKTIVKAQVFFSSESRSQQHKWLINEISSHRTVKWNFTDHRKRALWDFCTWSPAPTSSSVRFMWTPLAMSGDCCSIATSRFKVRQSNPSMWRRLDWELSCAILGQFRRRQSRQFTHPWTSRRSRCAWWCRERLSDNQRLLSMWFHRIIKSFRSYKRFLEFNFWF